MTTDSTPHDDPIARILRRVNEATSPTAIVRITPPREIWEPVITALPEFDPEWTAQVDHDGGHRSFAVLIEVPVPGGGVQRNPHVISWDRERAWYCQGALCYQVGADGSVVPGSWRVAR